MTINNKNFETILSSNFSDQFSINALNSIITGHDAFLRFKKENESFLSFEGKEVTACGHLRTLAIEKAFYFSSLNQITTTFHVSFLEVNNFHHKVLCIQTDDFIVNISRNMNPKKLPNASKYRVRFAEANGYWDNQLSFGLFNDFQEITSPPYYGIITYDFEHDSLAHAQLLIPDKNYKNSQYSINLMKTTANSEYYEKENNKEEMIINIKKELIKEIL
ncbi:hypothetical protein Q5O14_16460 [Eubacteriaceae bacterium ES2]|nr:hypothetical protein Q5O14_16460 [Eubacteriaceae bacterium ES2]